MLADDSAPERAASLVDSLSYAHGYAESLRGILAEGKTDPEKAAHLVQAVRNMLCAAEDALDTLDDTQAHIDAMAAMQSLSDAALFSAITDTPTYENP
ncbi:hypothetical protein [Streptomyces scabiei]|uniref:hypothetical protein n=1 Tax=Streptomyces scabiei TaxID=1930 RepID=UPI0029B9CBEA|nr:hypothetical protein [Streptomyces scabiei]MDX2804856.1 hypothetical protein [Streptomyces scabiei]